MNAGDWTQLVCPYFVPVCRAELSEHFAFLRLIKEAASSASILWTDDHRFVEISHIPETSPNYAMNVSVGLGNSLFDKSGNHRGVPIWFSKSLDAQRALDNATRFNSEARLREVLRTLRDGRLRDEVQPLLEDEARLGREIQRFRSGYFRRESESPGNVRNE